MDSQLLLLESQADGVVGGCRWLLGGLSLSGLSMISVDDMWRGSEDVLVLYLDLGAPSAAKRDTFTHPGFAQSLGCVLSIYHQPKQEPSKQTPSPTTTPTLNDASTRLYRPRSPTHLKLRLESQAETSTIHLFSNRPLECRLTIDASRSRLVGYFRVYVQRVQ